MLNPEKTKAMLFTKQRMPDDLPVLTIAQNIIQWVKTSKYLAYILMPPHSPGRNISKKLANKEHSVSTS